MAAGLAQRFAESKFIFEVGMMSLILEHAKNFMKQTESRTMTFDKFSKCLDATIARIKNAWNEFDQSLYAIKVKACRDTLPSQRTTSRSTRRHNSTNDKSTDDCFTEQDLQACAEKLISGTLSAIDQRFGNDSRIVIDNISMFTELNDFTDDEVLMNPLLQLYCNPMCYKHQGVEKTYYERTDEPLLSFRKMKNELPQVRVLISDIIANINRKNTNEKSTDKREEICLLEITKSIAITGQYLVPEWFKLYQIITTLPIGSNECERSFSAVRRIKTKLRNRLSTTALETAVKFTVLKLDVTDSDLDAIAKSFYQYPGRAKARNITMYVNNNDDQSDDEID